MMRKLMVMMVLGACSGGGPSVEDGTPLGRFLAEVVEPQGWSEDGVLIYGSGVLLMPGQTVGPAFDLDGEDAEPFTITEPTWFFWADLAPDQYFGHPTLFAFMDDEGGPVRTQDQNWFPTIDGAVFHPPDPVWGIADPAGGMASMELRDRIGEPCGPRQALVIQGFDIRQVDVSVARLRAELTARGYDVTTITRAEVPEATNRPDKVIDALRAFALGERASQLDIFYLGHGNQRGRWVFGAHEGLPATLSVTDIVRELGDAATSRVNIIIDSCYSGAFVDSGFVPLVDLLADSMASDVVVQVVASSVATQRSSLTRFGALGPGDPGDSAFITLLLDTLGAQDPSRAFDYSGLALGRFSVDTRTDSRPITVEQDPAPLFTAPPSSPVLFMDPDYDECQVVADLDPDNYQRRVVIRGAGFGDAEGTVEIMAWNDLSEAGIVPWAAFSMPIISWSDGAVEVQVPMRSEGFPADPSWLEGELVGFTWDANDPAAYFVGNYFVQLTTATGATSTNFEILPDGVAAEHFFAPQLLHISPQIQSLDWMPDFSIMVAVEWNEMWHPMTPTDFGLGTATVLVSDLRLVSETNPALLDGGGMPMPTTVRRLFELVGNRPHSTGPVAESSTGGWGYELPAAERDLDTARIRTFPEFNFWGFRQEMDIGWDFPGTWTFRLIYD